MATDQMGCSRTRAEVLQAAFTSRDNIWVIGESEIIVTAKCQQGPSVHCDHWTLGRFQRQTAPVK